jgi:hypothetical protein
MKLPLRLIEKIEKKGLKNQEGIVNLREILTSMPSVILASEIKLHVRGGYSVTVTIPDSLDGDRFLNELALKGYIAVF